MKSMVEPSSQFHSTQTAAEATNATPRTNTNNTSPLNYPRSPHQAVAAPGISPTYPAPHTSVHQKTFQTPGQSIQPYPAQYSLSPGVPPPLRDPYPLQQSGDFRGALPNSPFAPKTAAELGLLDRPDTSHEGMELSSIVDRMTGAFPMDVHSDMQVDVHNDLFLSASLIGEAMQSMVNTVSRSTATWKGHLNPVNTSKRDPSAPGYYRQGSPGYGDWPREEPEVNSRYSSHTNSINHRSPTLYTTVPKDTSTDRFK